MGAAADWDPVKTEDPRTQSPGLEEGLLVKERVDNVDVVMAGVYTR